MAASAPRRTPGSERGSGTSGGRTYEIEPHTRRRVTGCRRLPTSVVGAPSTPPPCQGRRIGTGRKGEPRPSVREPRPTPALAYADLQAACGIGENRHEEAAFRNIVKGVETRSRCERRASDRREPLSTLVFVIAPFTLRRCRLTPSLGTARGVASNSPGARPTMRGEEDPVLVVVRDLDLTALASGRFASVTSRTPSQ
jgi:hypothetical protein